MSTPETALNGRLIADPDLKFTASGKAVCNIRVACNDPKREDGSYGDGLIVNVSIWPTKYDEKLPETIADRLRKGDRVIVTGRLFHREYETSAGEKRQSLEVKFPTVAAIVESSDKPQQTPQQPASGDWSAPAGGDPWGGKSEPPF